MRSTDDGRDDIARQKTNPHVGSEFEDFPQTPHGEPATARALKRVPVCSPSGR